MMSHSRQRSKLKYRRPRVFVIHGLDLQTLDKTELLLHRIGVEPRVLKSLSCPGSTIIEALEDELTRADAIVCLFTPDDEGRIRGEESLKPRVRQNVLVESGYAVIGKRGKSIIIALGDVDIPSDFGGIRRIQGEVWDNDMARKVAHHLCDMGLPVNLSA